jgi:hypothetical protein
MGDVTKTSGGAGNTGAKKPRLLSPNEQQIQQAFDRVDTGHTGVVSKDQLIASETAAVTDPQAKKQLSDQWSHIYDQFAGQGGMHEADFANLVHAFTAPERHDVFQGNVNVYEDNLRARIGDLMEARNGLVADLGDPRKAPEAQARMQLIDEQIGTLRGEVGQVEQLRNTYHAPALDPEDPNVQKNPVLRNQATLQNNAQQYAAEMIAQKNALIPDLADPRKRDAALAKMNDLDGRISALQGIADQANSYNLPENLTPDQAKASQEMLAQANDQVKAIASGTPDQRAEAEGQATKLFGLMSNPQLIDPQHPGKTNDPTLTNQSIALQNAATRINDLEAEKAKLQADKADPSKAAEAYAREQLLDQQIAEVGQIKKTLEQYQRKPDLSPAEANASAEMIGKLNDLIKDVSDPNKAAGAKGQLVALKELLDNPKLYDPSAPMLTRDPVITNQAVAAQNVAQRFQDLVGQANNLIGDLGDPAKAEEANARLHLLNQQMSSLNDLNRVITQYKRPADLTPEQAQKTADMLAKLNDLAPALSDPRKMGEAKATQAGLGSLLHAPDLYDPHAAGFTNDPVIKNQEVAVQNVAQRQADLLDQANQLVGDMKNPAKRPEAEARMALLQMQLKSLGDIGQRLEDYRRPADLPPEQARTAAATIEQMNGLVKDLSDPKKSAEAASHMVVLSNVLSNPALANPDDPMGTSDPVVKNQALAVQNFAQRKADLLQLANDTQRDLANPAKQAEAVARLGLIDQQLGMLDQAQSRLERYVRPKDLNVVQLNHAAGQIGQISDLIKDLSDPRKQADSQTQLNALFYNLKHPQ